MTPTSLLYKLNFIRDSDAIINIIGEGNDPHADSYCLILMHGGKAMGITKTNGPALIQIYTDSSYNYYVRTSVYSRFLVYFANRSPINNTISATKVDIDISTLTQIGI